MAVKSGQKPAGGGVSAPSVRRAQAVESFQTAAECFGPVTPGIAVFAITRGQFSMIDVVLHLLDCAGPSRVSLWTWTVAEYEIENLALLRRDGRITDGRLVIDGGARGKNAGLIAQWKAAFGPASVRYVVNHAKIATVEGGGMRLLARGSANLNKNPRFEQFDLTEGGADFDVVRRVEDDLPIIPDGATGAQVYAASRVAQAFEPEQLAMYAGVKRWAR